MQESKGRYFISIPKEYVEMKGWKKGEVLVLGFNERGNIEIKEGRRR